MAGGVGKRFDILEHTADAGIVAYGAGLGEAFANAAYGLFCLMADMEQVAEKTARRVEVEAGDREGLVVAWLNELLYLFDVEHLLFRSFDIRELTDTRLSAEARGEEADASRHRLRGGVKAATYHMLRVWEDEGLYRIRVIFDV